MNKKSTLLAAAFMAVSSLTVSAADVVPGEKVTSDHWTAGKYYFLKSNINDGSDPLYLSLDETRTDSVVVRTLPAKDTGTKSGRDLALWEITVAKTETTGVSYQLKNKKTKTVLSFAKDLEADPVLSPEGVSTWSLTKDGDGYVIKSQLTSDKVMTLNVLTETVDADSKNKVVFKDGTPAVFNVMAPSATFPVEAIDLGNGFTTFQLSFGEEFEGDIFSGKDLIAVTKEEGVTIPKGYFLLQEKGNEAYPDGKKKFFGVDTLTIAGASNSFSLDSIRETIKPNLDAKLFKFTTDLKNDSLTMIVKGIPADKDVETTKAGNVDVKVVYAQLANKKILTINNTGINNYPCITSSRGVPAEITGGTGVYFLKSASKGENGGKYISSYKDNEIVPMTGTPSVNQLEGQWYIKEDGGMYSIVDRKSNTSMLLKGEVFAVQGMPNTFTFGGNADSITVEAQKVNLDDKFLGSVNFTKEQLANNGYVLNLVPAGAETSNSYAFTSDSILQVKTGDAKDAVVFKVVAVDTVEIGGAQSLKDTVSIVTYQLKSQFSDKYVAYDNTAKSLKVSDPVLSKDAAVNFYFKTNEAGTQYNMQIAEGTNADKFITADSYSSNMIVSETPAYFNFVEMDAPEYLSFESHHKRYTSELKSLTMNPLNFFAEAKQEGQDILKSGYEKDNFSLWTIKSEASTAERPLYFITTSLPNVNPEAERIRYYMVSGRDSALVDASDNPRVNFIANDTIETMKDSKNNPALFAMKVTESGNYLLENQKEVTLGEEGAPYVAIINNVVVMSKNGAEFSIESVAGPVANEAIDAPNTVKVIGGYGDLNILNAAGKKVTLSNVLGQTIAVRVVASDNETIAAARGIVIVSIEGEGAKKVIVK